MTKSKKKEIGLQEHPKLHKVTITMTDGSKFDILTTYGKDGDNVILDLDPKNHPAWQEKGQNYVNVNNERVNNFKKKFGDFKL
jgi:large subunit ribosomal protein L31